MNSSKPFRAFVIVIFLITYGIVFFSPASDFAENVQKEQTSSTLPLEPEHRSEMTYSDKDILPAGGGDRIMLIAPHSDDETIADFSYAKKSVENGAQVKLVKRRN